MYTKIREEDLSMSFGEALEAVKQGKGMRLPKWAPDVVIRAQYPDEHSKISPMPRVRGGPGAAKGRK